jgi:hypothetical protein
MDTVRDVMTTTNSMTRGLAVLAWLTLVAGVLAGCGPEAAADDAPAATAAATTPAATDTDAAREAALEQVRAATSRFQDVNVALAEGYVRDPGDLCDTAEMMGRPAEWGVMGIHYVRMDLLGITAPPNPRVTGTGTHTDFTKPGVLIYEPQADGTLALVAVENLVFVDAWEQAGNTQPPSFEGVPYDLMEDDPATEADEAHMFAPHYDLHMWLYRDNPRGMFAQYNPNATCAHHTGATTHDH